MIQCNIDFIKEVQQAFDSVGFNLFCTMDEDSGLHIAHTRGYLGTTSYDDREVVNNGMLEYLESGNYSMVRIDYCYFALNEEQRKIIKNKFIKVSSKRETIFIDWDYLYDNQ